jgi:acetyltransferase-like isoleucine patch superfamily enzyme
MIGKYCNIGDDVKIGKKSIVWHFCNLYGCTVGEGTQIGSYCEIKSDAVIGDYCRFQSYVFVPEGTEIGNWVFVGPRVTFLNDKHPTAEKSIKKNWQLQKVIVEDEVTIGGGVTILPGVRIGKRSVIGAGAVVTKDIPEDSVAFGNPAKIVGNIDDGKYEKFRMMT